MIDALRKLLGIDEIVKAKDETIHELRETINQFNDMLNEERERRAHVEDLIYTRYGLDAKNLLALKKEENEVRAEAVKAQTEMKSVDRHHGGSAVRSRLEHMSRLRKEHQLLHDPGPTDDNLKNFMSRAPKEKIEDIANEVDKELAEMDPIVSSDEPDESSNFPRSAAAN